MARTPSVILTAPELAAKRKELRAQGTTAASAEKAAKKNLDGAGSAYEKAIKTAEKQHADTITAANKALDVAKKAAEKVRNATFKEAEKALKEAGKALETSAKELAKLEAAPAAPKAAKMNGVAAGAQA
jgi:hypothetical protein